MSDLGFIRYLKNYIRYLIKKVI